MSGIWTREGMARLEPRERAELMRLQMSSPYGARSAYLPDDCGECGACGDACLGAGWCRRCRDRYAYLMDKMTKEECEQPSVVPKHLCDKDDPEYPGVCATCDEYERECEKCRGTGARLIAGEETGLECPECSGTGAQA